MSFLVRIRSWVETALDFAQIVFVVLLVFLCVYQVVTRYFFSGSTGWTETGSRYAFVWLIFLGAGLATLRNTHFDVEFRTVTRLLSARTLSVILSLSYLVFGIMLVWGGWLQVRASHRYFHPELGVRQSLLYLPAFLLGCLLVLRVLLDLLQGLLTRRVAGEETS